MRPFLYCQCYSQFGYFMEKLIFLGGCFFSNPVSRSICAKMVSAIYLLLSCGQTVCFYLTLTYLYTFFGFMGLGVKNSN